jgi:hypothetical protein
MRAEEVRSSMVPTLVITSSVHAAIKYAVPSAITFDFNPPSVGRTTPYLRRASGDQRCRSEESK